MGSDVWFTWHDKRFDCNRYLYHYTNIEKACKILFNESLRFSPIAGTNDTVEAKVKICFNNNAELENFDIKRKRINQYMQKYNEYLQLLCFSKDQKRGTKVFYNKNNDYYYVDMMGRGFSLPRMWAQYADNNKGVCLIIDKVKFDKELNKKMNLILESDVKYKPFFSAFQMDTEMIESLYESVCEDEKTTMTGHVFAKKHMDYVKYSFFTKYLDWKNENEYRYLIDSDNAKAKEVKNLSKYVAGIVLGEYIEDIHRWEIEQLAQKNKFEIKKIYFDYDCCRLE